MKTLTILLSLFLLSCSCYSQVDKQAIKPENIIGTVSFHEDSRVFGQEVALQGVVGNTYKWIHVYLTVQGEKFKLYKYSANEIKDLEKKNPNVQQEQKPLFVIVEDYYFKNIKMENGKYSLFQGVIDKENGIIYSASLLEVYDEKKIIDALTKYSQSRTQKDN